MALIWVAEPEDRRMDAKTLKYTRRRLSSEYENLIKSISRSRLAAKEIDIENTEDEGDLATISHERDLRYTLHDSDYARLRCIEEAIKAMDRGEYGKCVRCGEDINEKRLKAMPWATMCIRCQEEREAEQISSRMVLASLEAEEAEL
jgi:DnaK suppressor protein